MAHLALGKALRSWEGYLELLELQRRAAETFLHIGRARALRSWQEYVEEREEKRVLLLRLLRHSLYRCLRHWAASAVERAAKMERICTLVYSLASGHRCLRALNSWRAVVDGHHRAARRARALSHWLGGEQLASFRRWRACLKPLAAVRHFTMFAAAKVLRTWVGRVADAFTLRRALAAFANGGLRKGWNSWLSFVGTRRERAAKARAGLRTMLHLEVCRALNSWKHARQALQPLRRGIAHWRNAL